LAYFALARKAIAPDAGSATEERTEERAVSDPMWVQG
jgi:hypothetical protein